MQEKKIGCYCKNEFQHARLCVEKNGGGVVAHEPESLGTFSICSAHSDVEL